MRVSKSIVLVGLMGVGKSSVGKRLAKLLAMPFVDADEAIEQASRLSISEIFDRFGEPYFRDGERRVIARLLTGPPVVLATGGGAFINDETRALVLEHAIAVWIDAHLDTLVARVSRRDTRPLLVGKDPRAVLETLAQRRNPVYAQAPIHVQSDNVAHDAMAHNIMAAITRYLENEPA